MSETSFYVDVDNIKKHNGFVYYWQLTDYSKPTKGTSGDANSSIIKFKVDCGEEKQTWLNKNYYSQLMGRGKFIGEGIPNFIQYPNPKSTF